MQFKSIITVLSIALVATALPAENAIEKRTGSVTPAQCNASSGKQVCCNSLNKSNTSGGLLGLGDVLSQLLTFQCIGLVSVLSSNGCSSSTVAACCKTEQNGLVNLSNCGKLL